YNCSIWSCSRQFQNCLPVRISAFMPTKSPAHSNRGDFNIMRHSKEKNNNRFNDRWPFLFNAVIDSFDLREIELSGRQFTWANSLSKPTYEKLDRALMSTEWEFKYPRVTVRALDRGISDNTHLFI